ncbi:MAG TPA: polysaccharide biosynthesis/export family protein [Opitutaceae bacterium]|nr:polysaccharide biosynthesis/export family protein [Opitutaceae bacterium]
MNLRFLASARRLVGLGVILAGFAFNLHGEAALPEPAASQALAHTLTTNDKLNIVVVQEKDLGGVSRVNSKGTVNLTLVGEVRVAGLTIKEAQKAIEDAYRDGRFLRNPQVIINVEDYAPREIFINGEVKSPGKYQLPIEQIMTIDELVLKAGGFTDSAKGSAVKVTRKLPDGQTTVIGPIDVESIIKGRNKSGAPPLQLQPGDTVQVDQRLF